ncbi:MAG: polyprenyl synthetase family protein [Bdellovibrionota bacterium]|nr:MAG: polyprenyl synthetase family protein [Bdellovibrionota bacterium]
MASITLSAKMKKLMSDLEGLSEVEALVRSKFSAEAVKLTDISAYLFDTGGKRIRPVLALLVAKALGLSKPSASLIDVAAGIELIHMATLLHDDIIDKSPTRRHMESPYLRYGTPATLLTGDFLLVRAFSLCARLDRTIIDETERACVELTEGEILESSLWEEHHSVASCLRIAKKKTASLFRLAAFCGAYLAGNSPAVVEAAARFGEELGTAFQMLDDILDVTSDEDLLGKKTGTDLRERKPSLINVLWLQRGDQGSAFLRQQPHSKGEDELIANAVAFLRQDKEIIAEARTLAKRTIEGAHTALRSAAGAAGKRDDLALESLELLCAFTLDRLG